MDIMWARNSPEVGFGERQNPSASPPDAAPERRKKYAGSWSLPLPNPWRGTVTGQRGICLQLTIDLRENTAAESSAYPYRQFMHLLNMHPVASALTSTI